MIESLIILGINLILYGRTIFYGLVVDDIRTYREHRKKCKSWSVPLSTIGSYLAGSGSSYNKKIDHIITLSIHTITSILIYFAFGGNTVSFFTAVIFSIHPVTHQVSCWLNGKRYGVSAILCLLLMMFYPYMLGLYPLMMFFRVSGLPIIFFILLKSPVILLFFPLIGYLFRKDIIEIAKIRMKDSSVELTKFKLQKIVLFFKTFGFYVRHCLFPRNVFMWYPFLYYYGLTKKDTDDAYSINKDFWFGFGCFLVIGELILFNHANPVGFGLMWFVVFISIWCNLFTTTQTISDRYCYIALMGLVLAVTAALISFNLLWLGLIYFGYLAAKTDYAMRQYREIYSFHSYHINNAPNNPMAFIFKAESFIAGQGIREAHNVVDEGLLYNPNDFKLMCLKATCLTFDLKIKEARKVLEEAHNHLIPGKEQKQIDVINNILNKISEFEKIHRGVIKNADVQL